MPSSYLCNLVVPGFAKCGTTSLHEYLGQHPAICMSLPKEPHFFGQDAQHHLGPELHNSYFVGADDKTRYFGESSTAYCVWEPALESIAQLLDSPKLIVLLREPVERVVSHFKWMHRNRLETETLGDAIRQELDGTYDIARHRGGGYPWYIRHSRYSIFCPMMVEIFGPANVLFVKSEALARDPKAVFEKVCLFLGIDQGKIIAEQRFNETDNQVPVLPPRLKRTYARLPRVAKSAIRATGATRLAHSRFVRSCLGSSPVAPTPTVDEIEFVRKLLKPDLDFFRLQEECCDGKKSR